MTDMLECIRKHSEEVKELCISGLLTDGAHHKQWFLEQILEKMGYNIIIVRATLKLDGYDWESGIPP